jgi:hypothetical protein
MGASQVSIATLVPLSICAMMMMAEDEGFIP